MKKIIALLLALVLVFSLAACGNADAQNKDPQNDATTGKTDNNENAETAKNFKAGFIFLHDENSTYDLNFLNATKEACDALGVE